MQEKCITIEGGIRGLHIQENTIKNIWNSYPLYTNTRSSTINSGGSLKGVRMKNAPEKETRQRFNCLVCKDLTHVVYGRVHGGAVCSRKCQEAWDKVFKFQPPKGVT